MSFIRPLRRAKGRGGSEYNLLASRYVREFETKWFRSDGSDEALVGSADIQSLADLANAAEIAGTMRIVPFNKAAVSKVIAAFVLPIAPLALTVIPLDEVLRRLLKLIV
jgi:hypothetical protein